MASVPAAGSNGGQAGGAFEFRRYFGLGGSVLQHLEHWLVNIV